MLYKNYNKSGTNPQIPQFGFIVYWSAGTDPTDFMFTQQGKGVAFQPTMTRGQRGIDYRNDLPEGSVLIIPWLLQPNNLNAEFLIRIIAEGEVQKLEPYKVKEPEPFDFNKALAGLNLGGNQGSQGGNQGVDGLQGLQGFQGFQGGDGGSDGSSRQFNLAYDGSESIADMIAKLNLPPGVKVQYKWA